MILPLVFSFTQLSTNDVLSSSRGLSPADSIKTILPVTKARGQTSRPSEIAKRQSASAHVFTGRVIWSSGSSTRSSSVGALQLDYDKLAANYLAFIKLASIRIWLHAYKYALALLWQILTRDQRDPQKMPKSAFQ